MKYLKTKPVNSPSRGTARSAGIDFYVPDNEIYVIEPGKDVLINSGIKVKVPEYFVFIAFNKSGVATKRKLTVGACVIDEDYQGEIHIHLFNMSDERIVLRGGDKIVQFVLLPADYHGLQEMFSEQDLYPETSTRGDKGFGSTD